MRYTGPLRDEPLAVELHNTIYASKDGAVDALADVAQTRAWLEALASRLALGEPGGPAHLSRGAALPAGAWPPVGELVALRAAVRATLQAAVAGEPPSPDDLAAINAASRRAPRAPVAVAARGGTPEYGSDVGAASRADVVLAAFAADAIDLLCGPQRGELRSCGAPRCVLMFLRDHPRREWCSDGCGNRARQARHYQRHGTGR